MATVIYSSPKYALTLSHNFDLPHMVDEDVVYTDEYLDSFGSDKFAEQLFSNISLNQYLAIKNKEYISSMNQEQVESSGMEGENRYEIALDSRLLDTIKEIRNAILKRSLGTIYSDGANKLMPSAIDNAISKFIGYRNIDALRKRIGQANSTNKKVRGIRLKSLLIVKPETIGEMNKYIYEAMEECVNPSNTISA